MSNIVKLKDKEFEKYILYDKIQSSVKRLAKAINDDLKDEQPVFLGILNGAFIFCADLLKEVDLECEISFLKLSSYIKTEASSSVQTLIGLNEDVKGRSIIIVEDIVESGQTLSVLIKRLKEHQPKTIKVATLFYKPAAKKFPILKPDYVGFEIPNDFIVGYGLDYEGVGRNLKDVYKIVSD